MSGEVTHLAASRRVLEGRWWELQRTLENEVGYAPRRRGWILLAVAAAAGFSLAWSPSPPDD